MDQLSRRGFLGTSLGAIAGTLSSSPLGWTREMDDAPIEREHNRPDTLFLTWQRDPTTTMTVQWIGRVEGTEVPAISVARLGQSDWRSVVSRVRSFPTTNLNVVGRSLPA